MVGFDRATGAWARWSVSVAGLVLFALGLGSILVAPRPVVQAFVLRGVILAIALGIALFGYWLVRTDEPPDLIARVGGWGLAAGVVLGLLGLWADVSKLLVNQPLRSPVRFVLGGTTVGFLTGCVAGYYHEKSRRRAKELAAVRGERLEVLAGLLSHDLRSPLDVAYGRLRRLQQDLGEDHEDLAAIERSLDRIQDLVMDTRLLAGGEPIEDLETVALAQVAKQSWGALDTPAAELVVDSDLRFAADRGRVATLFQNLFNNAVEHGGGDVRIEIGRRGDGFYVEDDGPGIPAEERDRIFELGYAGEDGRSGLGLSIVNEVALQHGWEVTVTDGSDGGARFEVTGVSVEAPSP
ncbi:MAG: sensor histidine kinase [Halobacteriales archaeon]